jgi:23S rRNA pseudouridine2605 synthase
VLSKRGVCSRTQAAEWVRAGRVRVDGRIVRDPEFPTDPERAEIVVDDAPLAARAPVHLMLNKPRGLVTTARDERGRDTVYRCFDGARWEGGAMPWIAPVGRLDKASEGLLLFTNDPQWAAGIADPGTGPHKTYRVQIDRIPDAALLQAIREGVDDAGERLSAVSVEMLRAGDRNAWLEIVLDEGRNRQIRRLLSAFDIGTLRLIRVAIGTLALGELPKGAWRVLTAEEVEALRA